jgi:hypothetical protein
MWEQRERVPPSHSEISQFYLLQIIISTKRKSQCHGFIFVIAKSFPFLSAFILSSIDVCIFIMYLYPSSPFRVAGFDSFAGSSLLSTRGFYPENEI